MKMKQVLATGVALSMALSMAPVTASAADKVDINVIAAQYGQQTADWWANFVTEFNEANPDINLNVEVVSWNDIYTIVNTRIANGEAPDVLNIDVFADYQADDLLLPIQDVVSEETYSKMYDAFLAQSEVDGTVWAIPDLASARAMYYGVDIVPGNNFYVQVNVRVCFIKFCHEVRPPVSSLLTILCSNDVYVYFVCGGCGDDEGNWTLNSEQNVEAIQYAIDLVNSGYTNTDPANDTRYDLQDMFGAGKVAMLIAPNSLPTYIATGGNEVNYGVASIPSNTGESVSAGVMDRFMCFDNDYSDDEKAAISTFFDYFYDDARYTEWVDMEGFLPATKSGGEALAAANEDMASWIDILDSCKFYPTAKAEWADVKQGVINVEQNALLGGDVQELLDDLQAEIAG